MSAYITKLGNTRLKEAQRNLFLFPYAGGGSAVFKGWQEDFDETNVFSILYPGRENRFSEKAIDDIDVLVNSIFTEMKAHLDFSIPYFFFGHSMGTKIVYELALRIINSGYCAPQGIIISAGRAPCYKEPLPIAHLNDDGFVEGLKRFSGTPKELLENRDLIKVFLPTLRADFIIDETYSRNDNKKVSTDILALMGDSDTEMTLNELLKWEDYTTGHFQYEMVEGGHMFINANKAAVVEHIKAFMHQFGQI